MTGGVPSFWRLRFLAAFYSPFLSVFQALPIEEDDLFIRSIFTHSARPLFLGPDRFRVERPDSETH